MIRSKLGEMRVQSRIETAICDIDADWFIGLVLGPFHGNSRLYDIFALYHRMVMRAKTTMLWSPLRMHVVELTFGRLSKDLWEIGKT